MINIKAESKENSIVIEIEGHANYAPIGKDIVCSAVSVLYQTLMLSLNDLDAQYLSGDDSDKRVLKIEDPSRYEILLVWSFFVGVEAIANEYPNHVLIISA